MRNVYGNIHGNYIIHGNVYNDASSSIYSDENFFTGFNKRQTLFKLVFIFATFVFYTRIIRVSVVSDLNLERPS